MIQIHTSPVAVDIHNLKNVLEARGIACEVRGEYRRSAVGELPVNECWVELWIVNDEDEEAARRVLGEPADGSPPSWQCPACGETVEGQFSQCWNCQSDRSASEDDT